MTELEKYQKVNTCSTVEELQETILLFSDVNGKIQGRKKVFDAKNMSLGAKLAYDDKYPVSIVTREYGLRGQLLLLMSYKIAE